MNLPVMSRAENNSIYSDDQDMSTLQEAEVTILGAGPYGLSCASHLQGAGIEARVFGPTMSFWMRHMPQGMCLRSNWEASYIADLAGAYTLDAFCQSVGSHCPRPIPLEKFVAYGLWFAQKAVCDHDPRQIALIQREGSGFRVTLEDDHSFLTRRVIVAAGIQPFENYPAEFKHLSRGLASHSSEHDDLSRFRGKRVTVIGGGQSAFESAALLRENGAEVEVICRQVSPNWVGVHPRLHHLGLVSRMLYAKTDVGPAGISRLVAAPHVFRRFPRWFKTPVAYRSIRPAVAGWLKPRLDGIPVRLGRHVAEARETGSQLTLKLDDGATQITDHILLATGFKVDVARYRFLAPDILRQLEMHEGYPLLRAGLESSVAGLHFAGKPAAWSFGPILGFVSGAGFASRELLRKITKNRQAGPGGSAAR